MATFGKYKSSGWFKDSHRHSLAAKGVKTKHSFYLQVGDFGTVKDSTGVKFEVANYLKGNRNVGQEKSDAAHGISREDRQLIDQGVIEGPKRKFGDPEKIEEKAPIPTPLSEPESATIEVADAGEQQAQPVEGRLPSKEEVIPPRFFPKSEFESEPEQVREVEQEERGLTIADLGLQPASVEESVSNIRF